MIPPAVENLPAHAASRVAIPQWHSKTALESHAEKEGRDVGIDARRISGEPCPSTRNLASLEVQTAVPGKGGVPKIPETD